MKTFEVTSLMTTCLGKFYQLCVCFFKVGVWNLILYFLIVAYFFTLKSQNYVNLFNFGSFPLVYLENRNNNMSTAKSRNADQLFRWLSLGVG